MRSVLAIAVAVVLALASAMAQNFEPLPTAEEQLCTVEITTGCGVNKRALKLGRQAYEKGRKLQERHPDLALEAFNEAVRQVPRNLEYVSTRELLRQQMSMQHVKAGNDLASRGRTVDAGAEYQKALQLDPENQFAAERVREMAQMQPPATPSFIVRAPEMLGINLRPKTNRLSFNQTMDTNTALISTANAYGLKPNLDPTVPRRRVHFEIKDADFYEAMDLLCSLTGTFWVATSPTEITFAGDTAAAHRQLDRWAVRTFYLPEAASTQDLTDVSNLLRTMFDLRFIQQQAATSTITVRGPVSVLDAASKVLESLEAGRPQVMLDFEAYQISHQMTRVIGMDLPLQFSVFNIPAAAIAALKQLVASGSVTSLSSASLSAILAQLPSAQSAQLTALLQNPIATFGGGLTLMGVGVPPLTANFSIQKTDLTLLDRISIRAAHGNEATFRLGSRYPIQNMIYSSVYNTAALSGVLGGSYTAPYPSFNYEDLGFTLKAKPAVQGNEVRLDLDMVIRSLTAQNYNGLPVITQRSYKGVITVPDEQSVVVAGSVSESEQTSLSGVPGLSGLPLGNVLFRNTNKQRNRDDLLIVVTPHILKRAEAGDSPIIKAPPVDR